MSFAVIGILSFFALLLLLYLIAIALLCYQRQYQATIFGSAKLLVYASQSGQTAAYAQHTILQLQKNDTNWLCMDIQKLKAEHLLQAKQVIWMVSTYGEGDAPDTAQFFAQHTMQQSLDLSHLECAVLAVGDRHYTQFCGFAQRLWSWLQAQHAKLAFDMVLVDQWSASDLAHWQQQLSTWTRTELRQQAAVDWQYLQLHSRELLNAGSQGTGLYGLKFQFANPLQWQSGDILVLQPHNTEAQINAFVAQYPQLTTTQALALKTKNLKTATALDQFQHFEDWYQALSDLPQREYSIASIPSQQHLALVVRQEVYQDDLGLGSGLLTYHLALGESIQAHVRSHQRFHLVTDDVPMIFIGNGSGIAGLLAHLYQRQADSSAANWLIYGERQQQYDHVFADELTALQQAGTLSTCDLVYSRDQNAQKYVQDVLYAKAPELKAWLDAGAYIYVCGSLVGMGQAVDAALLEILGEAGFSDLQLSQRYRRDLY